MNPQSSPTRRLIDRGKLPWLALWTNTLQRMCTYTAIGNAAMNQSLKLGASGSMWPKCRPAIRARQKKNHRAS